MRPLSSDGDVILLSGRPRSPIPLPGFFDSRWSKEFARSLILDPVVVDGGTHKGNELVDGAVVGSFGNGRRSWRKKNKMSTFFMALFARWSTDLREREEDVVDGGGFLRERLANLGREKKPMSCDGGRELLANDER
ncbi:unnamed protein product [Linum trigynum]|uniref:Uncharacterized protein n=1 Tax=Linum trigynum TaxID=586398 RepID=A0AAV2CL20_9ROSI